MKKTVISTQTICNYITLGLLESIEYRQYSKQSKSKEGIAYNNRRGRSIDERPFELKERVFGNWEMDTAALDKLEREYKDKFSLIFKSITVDNDVEFLDMACLEKSVYNKLSKRTTIYYAHPYCSWERGSNENNNKLIDEFIKKKTDIKHFSSAYIKKYKTV